MTPNSKTEPNLVLLGSTEYIDIAGIKNIPAKIDTGADSSSIWASDIKMQENGVLTFVLFGHKSPYYTGKKHETTSYKAKSVRSSHGDRQIHYRVSLPVTIHGDTFETTFTLANRSSNNFPVLIGRRTLKGKFLVDVSREAVKRPAATKISVLNQELEDNPYRFHQKYIEKRERS